MLDHNPIYVLHVTYDQSPQPSSGRWRAVGRADVHTLQSCPPRIVPEGTETRVDGTYNSQRRPGFRAAGCVPRSQQVCGWEKRMVLDSHAAQGACRGPEWPQWPRSYSTADW